MPAPLKRSNNSAIFTQVFIVMFNTPILFIIYNRPNVTEEVFKRIRNIQPKQLFVVADGPKNDKDKLECEKSRKLIKVNWDCDHRINYRERNYGCKENVSSGISWAFKYVDNLIILEDDTLPDSSFFTFCSLLLEKYKDNKKIMSITGVNWLNGRGFVKDSYYFSNYSGIWGWATWKDRWDHFDSNFQQLYESGAKFLDNIVFSKEERAFHLNNFQSVLSRKVDTWDFIWHYTHFINNAFCIIPHVNLVSNIGFGFSATHTKNEKSWKSKRKTKTIRFPLKHPKLVERNQKADFFLARRNFLNQFTLKDKFFDKLYNWFG